MTSSFAPTRLHGYPDIQHYQEAPIGAAMNTGPAPLLSVIVPTRNESGNIPALVARLSAALAEVNASLVFVDDSDDDTVAAIEAARAGSAVPIVLLHRAPGQREGGLGGAVLAGLRAAEGTYVCVMDADLQHPPALVPQMLESLRSSDVDVVIASRYWQAGAARGLNRPRTLASRCAADAARLLFPSQLREVTDPMSGFFLVRKAAIVLDDLHPRGFKILLEILVRNPHVRVAELGFEFGKRHAGTSKASLNEGTRYLAHLAQLRFGKGLLQFLSFLLVGLSGLLVNTLALTLATELLGLHYLVSVVLATEASTLWNFVLTERWVFSAEQQRAGRGWRMLMFFAMNNAALLLRGPMIYLLTDKLAIYYVLSNVISLVALTVLRYTVADKLIWGRAKSRTYAPASHSYDIHGVITVASEVALPELEQFRVVALGERPTIRVHTGVIRSRAASAGPAANGQRHIHYDEGLGVCGFGIDVTLGETIDVLASPILRWSPHVLYTNVVEPILRWTFVEKGYALVHGACISFGEQAYMITARTDTGKTTTILKLLDRQRRTSDSGSFLSDDLTLVTPSGGVLTYPKPMTISHHTVAAINTPQLSRLERLTLPLQSRLHSREGRQFAFWLTNTKLPVATINTIVQLLVPPPKYHVQQLVPHVRVRPQAQLAGLIIIQRGGQGEEQLPAQEGLDMLLANCEDAYGFPPYDVIKTTLHSTRDIDLRAVERTIIGQALQGLPTTLVRSSTMDWAERIPALVQAPQAREVWAPRERAVGAELGTVSLSST
ncbi:MAG: glycosyltransferase [Kouleothrix sp.]|jgi:putative flippase GtrA|nr:glycosyltransferase [Kouleothrix sp.]